MGIIKGYITNNYLNKTSNEPEKQVISQPSSSIKTDFNKNLKIANYFEHVYTYPTKIKLKWDLIDELKDDRFVDSKYHLRKTKPNPKDLTLTQNNIEDWVFETEATDAIVKSYYSKDSYLTGFLNKISSSTFFQKKTKEIQSALENIPVFVILNGNGEIALSKPSNNLGSKKITAYLNEKVYDSFGAFDLKMEKKPKLGLFFLDYNEAQNYLKEIAKSDFEGTKTLGLSTHCISLDSAYKITREHHPGIDFRFVPNFIEVKKLLVNNIGKSDTVIEDEQQQLRFRSRNANIFPYLGKLGRYIFPFKSSFLRHNEYFKGVPIYIVQVKEKPTNWGIDQCIKVINQSDVIFSRFIKFVNTRTGCGDYWLMQDSIRDIGISDRFKNYVFFEKDQALKFCKKNGRKVARYNAGHSLTMEFLARKPKILVYNLEDFLEDWEDNLIGKFTTNDDSFKTLFNGKGIQFVSSITNLEEIASVPKTNKFFFFRNLSQLLDVKFRTLKQTVGVFFSL